MRFMNIGKRYWEADTGRLSLTQKAIILPYLEKLEPNILGGIGLALFGANGIGKTYIAALLCKLAWQKVGAASYLISADELKDCWIEDKLPEPGATETVTNRVKRLSFVVIDDIGKEHRTASGFSESKFGSLLRHRVKHKLTTVLTSNLSVEEFTAVYGLSVKGLLQESGVILSFDGPDMRERQQASLRKEYF